MDFRTELAKGGYNRGNSIDVETLINEILPSLSSKQNKNLYSEEDLREAFRQGEQNISYSEIYGLDSKLTKQEWFEKFKKK